MRALIVIPAYNEAKNIQRVVDDLINNYPEYNYIVINDGSTDNTIDICLENDYNVLDLPVNIGLAGAFQTGMKYAFCNDYDCAIQFDGDGQHKAEYIEPMLEELSNGFDIIIGSRFKDEKKPFNMRMLGSFLISLALKLTTGKTIKDPTSGMRVFSRHIIKDFAQNINYGPEPDTIAYVIRRGAKVKEVQISADERIHGESYLNFARSSFYMIKMGLSIMLLQFFRKKDSIAQREQNNLKECT